MYQRLALAARPSSAEIVSRSVNCAQTSSAQASLGKPRLTRMCTNTLTLSFPTVPDCRKVDHCSTCQNDFCQECRPVHFFECCDMDICIQCMVPGQTCDNCDTMVCTKHVVKCEGECERSFCESCCKVHECDLCSGSFCAECRPINVFNCCEKTMCVECMLPEGSCDACKAVVCSEHTESCETCEGIFCCCLGVKPCGGCGLFFCGDDCAFVDVCESCDTTYCQECAVVIRCAWCSHSACEKCRKKGGFCRMCNDKPPRSAKKRRLTGS